ncbi:MAG TPA: hypothetical protein VLX92_10585 [Kofleriaceae bacterium]|nr:hypothetical protein [Kofleriaceae bacterium]
MQALAALFDNPFVLKPIVEPDGGRTASLATMLATEDLACLESIVFALGFELVP